MKTQKEYLNSEVAYWISEVIHSKRNREILTDLFIDGLTQDEVAGKYNLSVDTIKKIVRESSQKIFSRIHHT